MTTIDDMTGLPELPKGYIWHVSKHSIYSDFLPGTSLGRKLNVAVRKSSSFAYEEDEATSLAYANANSIRKAANRALRKFNRKQAKRRRQDYLNDFIGDYPPKKLED